jgi:hypothetical protein
MALVYCFAPFGEPVCSRKALARPVVPEQGERLLLRRYARQRNEQTRQPVRHYAEGES